MLYLAKITFQADGDMTDAFAKELQEMLPLSVATRWEAIAIEAESVNAADAKVMAMIQEYLRSLAPQNGVATFADTRIVGVDGCKPCFFPPPDCHTSGLDVFVDDQSPLQLDGIRVVIHVKYRSIEKL